MATTALAQEKVWLDKSTYDKAERLHHEKLAKVLPHKIMDSNSIVSNTSASIELQGLLNANPAPKSKSKKVKIVTQENVAPEVTKNSKNSKKNKNKKEESITENTKPVELIDNIGLKSEDSDINNTTVGTKKYKAKEAKEKKNKADKKHRNLEEDKGNIQENKEQFSTQGSQPSICSISPAGGSLANEVAKARQHIKQSLQCMDGIEALAGVSGEDLTTRVSFLEKENQDLRNITQELKTIVSKLEKRVKDIEGGAKVPESAVPNLQICPQKPAAKDDEDDDVDLFGSDSEGEDAEAAKVREQRLAAYAAKKSKKPALIAKSNIILDVKPWDDETDMKAMEVEVRKIQTDGLLWGAAKLVPVAFNIQKLQISCVVEDDKVSVDWLTEQIQEIEDFVQSVDIAAFNKV